MNVTARQTNIPGVVLLEPQVFTDDRGFFLESYHIKKYELAGIKTAFVQDNHSHSVQGVLRGLHYQLKHPQAKLIYVVRGEIFDVAVDIRRGSPTFGQWTGKYLSEENKRQLYIPEGFAHGFFVTGKEADVIYKCTEIYTPGDEFGLLWSDPGIDIKWPQHAGEPLLSEKDRQYLPLGEIPQEQLPVYAG